VDDDVGDLQPAARAQDAIDLPEHGVLVGHQVDHAVGDHDVDRAVLHRQRLDQRLVQLEVGEAHLGRARASALEHRRRHVDTDRAAARAGHLRRDQQVGARSAAEVEDHVPGLDPPERPVIGDAGEALDRRVGHARQLRLWVASSCAHQRPVGKMNS
jgi:hypothetical protein